LVYSTDFKPIGHGFWTGFTGLKGSNMQKGDDKEQFEVLEEKVDSLIHYAGSLKKEKESLLEKIHFMEEKIGDLAAEVDNLKAARDKAKQRVVYLLEKLEQVDITG
jgi:chromosome segregation ATPase